jgi:hypothetical protein
MADATCQTRDRSSATKNDARQPADDSLESKRIEANQAKILLTRRRSCAVFPEK